MNETFGSVCSNPVEKLPTGGAGFSQYCQVLTGLAVTVLALAVVGTAIAVPLLTTKGQLTTNGTESTSMRGVSFVVRSNLK